MVCNWKKNNNGRYYEFSLKNSNSDFIYEPLFNSENYYKNAIGVSVSPTLKPERCLYVNHKHAPYVVTKPFHHSQKVIEKDN